MLDFPTVPKAIEFAVATEGMGVRTYTKLAERFSEQEDLSEAFAMLVADEKAHRAQFEALLEELEPDDDIMTDEEKHRYLCAMARSEFFKSEAGSATKWDDVQSLDEALTKSLDFEKATLGLYLAIQDIIGEDESLGAIIEAEKRHVARLMRYILTEEKMKGLGDGF